MLEFRNVSVSCQHTPILNDISLTFRDGEITTILGPNGCGKTTLVQCLNGASTVTAGQIFLNGQDFLKISPKERAREISLLPQVRTIIPAIPVKMLVEHGRFPYLGFSRRKSKEDTEIVNRAMEFTHISQYADQYVDTLSGGIRQRVFFAMVLAQDCDYIVLDEPTTYLVVPNVRIEGDVRLRGEDIFSKEMQLTDLRRRVGMVFQKANPFPMSIYDNITYGPRLHGVRNKAELDELVESSLRGAALWDEVKDRLKKSALGLSGGQQQRLCIARALAVKPEVLLMDEPTSALDPGSTMKVEELMSELKKNYTVVIVTHNMQQAARISDCTAFFLLGELVECGPTSEIFSTPKDKRTEDYISGRFG